MWTKNGCGPSAVGTAKYTGNAKSLPFTTTRNVSFSSVALPAQKLSAMPGSASQTNDSGAFGKQPYSSRCKSSSISARDFKLGTFLFFSSSKNIQTPPLCGYCSRPFRRLSIFKTTKKAALSLSEKTASFCFTGVLRAFLCVLELAVVEVCVEAVFCEQFFMRALLHDVAVLHAEDEISVADC